MPYVVVDADEIEPGFGGAFRQIRRQLGVRAFGINQVDLPPGAAGRAHDHAESGQEEVYVLAGSGTMLIDGEQVELRPGRYLFVAPGSTRRPHAGAEGLSWVVVGAPRREDWEPEL